MPISSAISGLLLLVVNFVTFWLWYQTFKTKREEQKQGEKRVKQIGLQNVELSKHEMCIAADLVEPSSMETTWSDIGGLDDVINEMKKSVFLPIQKRHLYKTSKLLQSPKGVLLHGPPGCGKTLIAKATAKEASFRFLNLQLSTLNSKWYGESQKLAAAVFSLAIKIQPCVIFIDEIDAFLRNRSSSDHEVTAMMKAQFLSLWDGLDTDDDCQVIIMGATNRLQDLDPAILRRMPTKFRINPPNLEQRESILRVILQKENTGTCVDLREIANATDGFSGSDLKETCREAALLCLWDSEHAEDSSKKDSVRPIQQTDLQTAVKKMTKSKLGEKLVKQIGMKNVELSEYEMCIAAYLVDPSNMDTTWSDIGGLDDVIAELKKSVFLPIKKSNLNKTTKLFQPPRGVLLHGPPGCGKTLIAKAAAKEASFRFLNLQLSTLKNKWYGESQKLAAAIFSLAIKIQPCVIFIDEIDAFLRNRSSSDHEDTAMMKAQFLSLWDGLDTDYDCQVIIMGATNRPEDLDPAILRRMPTKFRINLPNLKQRESILRVILQKENTGTCVDLHEIANATDGFSGSDLKETCQEAALLCLWDSEHAKDRSKKDGVRPIQQSDLQTAVKKMKESKMVETPTVLLNTTPARFVLLLFLLVFALIALVKRFYYI